MGALCYPEFVLKLDTTHTGTTHATEIKSGLRVAQETV